MSKRCIALCAAIFLTVGLSACSTSNAKVIGVWGDPDAEATPSLIFDKNGEVHGTDGCNLLGGNYKLSGSTVTFSEFRSTMMYCQDVDTWLQGGRTAEVSTDLMTLFDEDGKKLGTLERQ